MGVLGPCPNVIAKQMSETRFMYCLPGGNTPDPFTFLKKYELELPCGRRTHNGEFDTRGCFGMVEIGTFERPRT